MFPFWNFRGRFLAEASKGKAMMKIMIFSRSAVSFKQEFHEIHGFLNLLVGAGFHEFSTDP